jgi:hypothetical protein
MTRVRTTNVRNVPDGEYEFMSFAEDADWIVGNERGDTFLFAGSGHPLMKVEVCCDWCGQWVDQASAAIEGKGWRCYGGTGPCGTKD